MCTFKHYHQCLNLCLGFSLEAVFSIGTQSKISDLDPWVIHAALTFWVVAFDLAALYCDCLEGPGKNLCKKGELYLYIKFMCCLSAVKRVTKVINKNIHNKATF